MTSPPIPLSIKWRRGEVFVQLGASPDSVCVRSGGPDATGMVNG